MSLVAASLKDIVCRNAAVTPSKSTIIMVYMAAEPCLAALTTNWTGPFDHPRQSRSLRTAKPSWIPLLINVQCVHSGE